MPQPSTNSGASDKQSENQSQDTTVSFSQIIGSQIRFLVGNLNKKNFKSSVVELKQITNLYGYEAYVYLLQILFQQIDFRDQKGNKDQLKQQLLGQETSEISSSPNFTTIFTQSLIKGLESIPEEFVTYLSKVLKLPLIQELFLALGLIDSIEPQLQQQGIKFLKTKLSEVVQNQTSLTEQVLHQLLYILKTTELPQKQKANVIKAIQTNQAALEYPSIILLPFIEDSIMDSKRSFARETDKNVKGSVQRIASSVRACDLVEDLGYSAFANASSAKSFFANFPDLKELDIAMLIGTMARTYSGLEDSLNLQNFGSSEGWGSGTGSYESSKQALGWNVAVFTDVVKELYPKLNWPTIIARLDHPGFQLTDQKGLVLIVTIYKRMTREAFPVDAILASWKNTLGQISFLRFAVTAPPEIFSFPPTPQQVAQLEGLVSLNKTVNANNAWNSLELIEVLFRLAETEHYPLVRAIFEIPTKHCPEVLILGIAQVKPTWPTLQQELFSNLMPLFLSNHPNSSFVIHRLWAINRQIVIRGMVEAYTANKSTLSRLLDIAQDLKALSPILEARPFSFTIDLAALASRREYLNLEKWLQERINEHGLPFIKTCLAFLKERTLASRSQKEQGGQKPGATAPQLSQDTLNTFFTCLWSKLNTLPTDVADDLKQLKAVINLHSAGSFAFPADIEEQANSFFSKIYTGKLSIEEAINLLKSFKTSKNPREQEIFACMIHNLLDEYRFFPKYPEKELRITGILFGSMIQHQLVSYVPLGIALRYVLDALRKPPNTKFFKFALYALEQFKTRLVEWPQYCSHIYAIPHFKNPEVRAYLADIVMEAASGVASVDRPVPTIVPPGLQAAETGLDISNIAGGSASPAPTIPMGPGLNAASIVGSGQVPTNIPQAAPLLPPVSAPLAGLAAAVAPAPAKPEVVTPAPAPAAAPAARPVAAPPGLGGVASLPPGLAQATAPPPGLGVPAGESKVVSAAAKESVDKTKATSGKEGAATNGRPSADEGIQSSLPLDTMLSANTIIPPEEAVQDKIHFIINNLAEQNFEVKVKELKDILKQEHYPYFAQYVVTKRVSIEANNHPLYLNLFEKLKLQQLTQLLLTASYENIRLLLRSEKIKTSSAERSLLKNLGSWLGQLTLAKNKPLIHKHLSLKDILYDAYEQGKLIAVVPFVCKVLEACKNSKIFAPPNVWLMANIRLLKEVYSLPDIKMNPKLTIEVLCNNLGIVLDEVLPTNFLAARKAKAEAEAKKALQIQALLEPSQGELGVPIASGTDERIPGTTATSAELLAHISNYCQINPGIPIFLQNVQLKKLVPLAIEKSIREIIGPVLDRSVTIACITTRELISKDFAMEPDEQKMRKAAHMMVQHLASSLALVTCKEPLRASMSHHLHSLLVQHILDPGSLEQIIQTVCAENLDVACSIIEKSATEKALAETDEQLTNAYMKRRAHKDLRNNQPFFDLAVLGGRYPSALPEPLRPKPGGLNIQQLRVYDDFARLPRHTALAPIRPPSMANEAGVKASEQVFANQGAPFAYQLTSDPRGKGIGGVDILPDVSSQLTDKLKTFLIEVEKILQRNAGLPISALSAPNEITNLMRHIPGFIANAVPREETALALAQDIFIRLFEADNKIYRQVYLVVLESVRDVFKKITKEITAWVIYSDDEKKLNKDVIPALIQSRLISVNDFDAHLYKMIDNGRNASALDFAMFLLRSLLDSRFVSPFELANTIELLTKISTTNKGPESLIKLLDDINTSGRDDKRAPREKKRFGSKEDGQPADPSGFREMISALFDEWITMVQLSQTGAAPQSDRAIFTAFITKLQQQGIFKSEETTTRFFQVCTELAIESAFSMDSQGAEVINYQGVDAFCKMIVWMVKYYFPETANNNRIQLLTTVLTIVGRVLARDYEMNKTRFNQRPYFRMFVNWLTDLNAPDPVLDVINLQILLSFSNKFILLSPCRLPGFAFAWLELISHRMFMPKLLLSKSQKGWPLFQRLLVELFKFLETYLRNAELNEPIRLLYKGTLRVLLVLLHDFPEFLCDYHFSFCDVIPPSCIQMRNLILSAFPRNMRLPDPFTPNLKVDLLPEISQPPRILSNYTGSLSTNNFKQEVDTYLKTRAPLQFLIELPKRLLLSPQEAAAAGTRYNVPMLNALVLYVGIQAISQLQKGSSQVTSPITHSAPMDIFQHLAVELDTEGRYLFLNAIANQLRYPNNHTHYFSCVLLYLFAEAHQMDQSMILEQITRVLLERLIANRPHPWGLLITFIELIKNPRYNFWSHSFTRLSPEIERLFDSVARSCIVPAKGSEKQG